MHADETVENCMDELQSNGITAAPVLESDGSATGEKWRNVYFLSLSLIFFLRVFYCILFDKGFIDMLDLLAFAMDI